jgi:hypothetical protein
MAFVVKSLGKQTSSRARSADGCVLHSRACVSLAVALAASDAGIIALGLGVADSARRLLLVRAVIIITSAYTRAYAQ